MRFLCSVALVLSFMAASLQGQTTASGTPYEQYLERLTSDIPGKASIHIQQDERMAKFINKHTESMHQKQLRGIPGYRIRIFFDGSQTARKKMNQVKGDFMRVFVNLDVYPDYKAPYWRIYVGDFRTSSEALKEYTRIRKVYPNALLVNDYIKIPEMK